jgi:predicted site-specific integrase-resolvase
MTKKEFAERAGISVSTLERKMKARAVGYIKYPGGRVVFLERHLEEFFARHERAAIDYRKR